MLRNAQALIKDAKAAKPYEFAPCVELLIMGGAFKETEFKTMKELITSSGQGLGLTANQLITLIYFRRAYLAKAQYVVDYLVKEEGWLELGECLSSKEKVRLGLKSNEIGDNQHSGSSGTSTSRHDSSSGITKRLARDAETDKHKAQLLEKVGAGELTANAAAIQAGYRQRTAKVQLNPSGFARQAQAHLAHDELAELHSMIGMILEGKL